MKTETKQNTEPDTNNQQPDTLWGWPRGRFEMDCKVNLHIFVAGKIKPQNLPPGDVAQTGLFCDKTLALPCLVSACLEKCRWDPPYMTIFHIPAIFFYFFIYWFERESGREQVREGGKEERRGRKTEAEAETEKETHWLIVPPICASIGWLWYVPWDWGSNPQPWHIRMML